MLRVSEGTEVRCLFMQEDISCSVTKDFSGHIETSEHGGMELPSKLSSTIIHQNTTAFHACAEQVARRQRLMLSIQNKISALFSTGTAKGYGAHSRPQSY